MMRDNASSDLAHNRSVKEASIDGNSDPREFVKSIAKNPSIKIDSIGSQRNEVLATLLLQFDTQRHEVATRHPSQNITRPTEQ